MEQDEWNPAWRDEMGFGIPKLDAEDRRLGALVHELNQAIGAGRDAGELQRLMNQILLDAVSHFEHEEEVFSKSAYPLPKGHVALHHQMRAELEHAMEKLRDVKARAMWAEYGLLVAQLFAEHKRQETMTYRNRLGPSSLPDSQEP